MPGKSPAERTALERQNAAIMAVFERAGFEHIQPDILQPADVFLESSGEDIRARTYVFTDPSGAEMCLRPDLTVPACRYHLSHAASPRSEARYCYCGPAFRFPHETEAPGEFTQAGIEWYAAENAVASEARVLKLTLSALEAAGLEKPRVTIGDLGLFTALLADIAMPERWRARLRRQFWRPQAFQELLSAYAAARSARRSSISGHVDRVEGLRPDAAEAAVAEALAGQALPLVGGRSEAEIAQRLLEKAADRAAKPLSAEAAGALQALLLIDEADATQGARAEIAEAGARYANAVTAYNLRIAELEDLGLNPRRFRFAAAFGRELEYYTGFVFQIEAGGLVIAGGGRYDRLMQDIGSPEPVTAVGAAIYTDRLKAVLT